MSKHYTRTEVLARLKRETESGKPLFMANAGCALTAKLQEMGGADLIAVSPTSYWRMKGLAGAMAAGPFFDMVQCVFDLMGDMRHVVKDVPLLALTEGHNPMYPHIEHIERLREAGISGVNPWMYRGFGKGYDEFMSMVGMGWEHGELEFVRTAREMEMFSFAYCFTPEEAALMAEAGADAIAAHIGGPTVGGLIGGNTSLGLDDAAKASQMIFDAARAVNPDVLLFSHGGPICSAQDAAYIAKRTNAQGFVGGSASERIPIETAVLEATKSYKNY